MQLRVGGWRIVAMVLGALAAAPLHAQDEPKPPRQYGRALPVDAKHTRLDISVDVEREIIEGMATLVVAPIGKPLTTLSLDAEDLVVASVTDASGTALSYENTGSAIEVYFDPPAPAGEDATIVVAYRAERPEKGLYFRNANNGYTAAETNVWSQGETEDNRYWFPSWDFPNDRATSEIVVRVPSQYQAFANGGLVRTTDNGDGTTTYHWLHDVPHANYLISLVIGDYIVVNDQAGDIPLKYIVRPEFEETVQRSFGRTPEMMAFFETWTGEPYPWGAYSQIAVVDFIYGGMENTGITTMTERMLYDEAAGLTYTADALVAHELIHQWFGDLLTCRDWSHLWLNEGFATYFQALWYEDAFGYDEFALEMLQYQETFFPLDEGAARAPVVKQHYDNPEEAINRRVYNKGAWVLHMLRARLGDELFQRGVREYIQRHKFSAVETNQLMRVLEEVSGEGLEKFFDQWLYQAGYPEITFSYTWDEAASRANVTIKQTQKVDTLTPVFEFTVPVLFALEGEDRIERVTVTGTEKSLSVPLPSRPLYVRFDPDGALLKKLTYAPGKDQLLAQLKGDSRILGRIEALDALTEFRTQDVLDAMVKTLESDPFWGVRARAAKALGELEHPGTTTPLIAALAQPEAKVRRAAAKALDSAYDKEAGGAALIRTAQEDSSPYVVAMAITSLGTLLHQPAVPQIRTALGTSSHTEVVRKAAITALGQLEEGDALNDVAALAAPGQPRDSRQEAILGIAQIGRWMPDRGRARETLEGFLNDPNRRFRMVAVTGLSQMADDLAIPALQAYKARTKNEREQKAADEAIKALREGRPPQKDVKDLQKRMETMEEANKKLMERLEKLESKPEPAQTPAGEADPD